MNLHDLCLFLLKEVRTKKSPVSVNDEFLLIRSLVPAKISGEFSVLFDQKSGSDNRLRAFMTQAASANMHLMAVSSYFQTHPDQIEKLLDNCRSYLDREKKNLNEKVFLSTSIKWRKALKLPSGSAFERFLREAETQNESLPAEHLSFMFLLALCYDSTMLPLMYRSLSEYREKKAEEEKNKPVKDLIYEYCVLFNMAAKVLGSPSQIHVRPLGLSSFSAIEAVIETENDLANQNKRAANKKPAPPSQSSRLKRGVVNQKEPLPQEILDYQSAFTKADSMYYECRDLLTGEKRKDIDQIAYSFFEMGELFSVGKTSCKEEAFQALMKRILKAVTEMCR